MNLRPNLLAAAILALGSQQGNLSELDPERHFLEAWRLETIVRDPKRAERAFLDLLNRKDGGDYRLLAAKHLGEYYADTGRVRDLFRLIERIHRLPRIPASLRRSLEPLLKVGKDTIRRTEKEITRIRKSYAARMKAAKTVQERARIRNAFLTEYARLLEPLRFFGDPFRIKTSTGRRESRGGRLSLLWKRLREIQSKLEGTKKKAVPKEEERGLRAERARIRAEIARIRERAAPGRTRRSRYQDLPGRLEAQARRLEKAGKKKEAADLRHRAARIRELLELDSPGRLRAILQAFRKPWSAKTRKAWIDACRDGLRVFDLFQERLIEQGRWQDALALEKQRKQLEELLRRKRYQAAGNFLRNILRDLTLYRRFR